MGLMFVADLAKVITIFWYCMEKHDKLLPIETSKSLVQHFAHGKFQVIEGQGHCANIESPEKVREHFSFVSFLKLKRRHASQRNDLSNAGLISCRLLRFTLLKNIHLQYCDKTFLRPPGSAGSTSEVRDEYNRGGLIAFLFYGFLFRIFLYLVVINKGVDLGENVVDPNAPTAEGAVPAFDITKVKEPWVSTPELVTYGAKLFKTNCAMCHGDTGHGDGAAGAAFESEATQPC